MVLSNDVFKELYHDSFRDDTLTEALLLLFADDSNGVFAILEECNNAFHLPPMLTFLLLFGGREPYHNLIETCMVSEADNRYYGNLFGYIFRISGYYGTEEVPVPTALRHLIRIKSASCFSFHS